MKKILALAGLAAALMVFAPMSSQADPRYDRHGKHDRWDRGDRYDHRWDRGDRRWDRRPQYKHRHYNYRHQVRRDFYHWRPYLERARYRNFGRPAYYGNYYRVRAHDYRGRIVILDVNAYTGAILRVGF